MTDTTRDLIQRLANALNEWQLGNAPPEDTSDVDLINEADAYLDQPEPEGLTDEELLALMPKSMRDDFSCAAKASSDATGGQVKPGIFRVCLNHSALEYARALIAADRARCGFPTTTPTETP